MMKPTNFKNKFYQNLRTLAMKAFACQLLIDIKMYFSYANFQKKVLSADDYHL
jgi:hypothetical protein